MLQQTIRPSLERHLRYSHILQRVRLNVRDDADSWFTDFLKKMDFTKCIHAHSSTQALSFPLASVIVFGNPDVVVEVAIGLVNSTETFSTDAIIARVVVFPALPVTPTTGP